MQKLRKKLIAMGLVASIISKFSYVELAEKRWVKVAARTDKEKLK